MEIITAIEYSFNEATWVTWLAIFVLVFQTIKSFKAAYENNDSYEQMRENKDKRGLANFYTAIITSGLCTLVFFLPYLFNYQG